MRLFDSHTHIDDPVYGTDFADMLERAAQSAVKGIMVVGIDVATSERAAVLARDHEYLISSVGIHPHDAKKCSDERIGALARIASNNPCVRAWGETGLDFNRMYSPARDQETCFEKQIAAASRLNLPMIFHERDSGGRLLDILSSADLQNPRGVVHCFSGTKDEMFQYLDMGFFIGITGILTIEKRGAYLRELAPMIPEDRILIETDAPYLTPAPEKNKTRRNEPAFVRSVLLRLARVRETDAETLADIVWRNTETLFGPLG